MDTILDRTLESETLAFELAAWCELDVEIFSRIYEAAVADKGAAKWPELVARCPAGLDLAGTMQMLVQAACQEAMNKHALTELALQVSHVQLALGKVTPASADAMVKKIASSLGSGRMQALVKAGGLKGRRTLYGAIAVDQATAIVYKNQRIIGTAFLVGQDLVITAAHVVLRSTGKQFEKKIVDGLSFAFGIYEDSVKREKMVAYPAERFALVDCSLPWGEPPNKLFTLPQKDAASRLDYALIRLNRKMHDIKPLDIMSPPKACSDDSLLVLGFPGGTAMSWDVGTVASVDNERLKHRANTMPGMSGSCCIDVDGKAIALHEGSLEDETYAFNSDRGSNVLNRAVCLWDIRNAMRTGATDPLHTHPKSPGLAFYVEALVLQWTKAGLRFVPDTLKDKWNQYVQEALGVQENGRVSPFHPWFERESFERWINENLTSGESFNRLCVINGGRGTGKSFLAAIVRATVQNDINDVVVISATETTAWSWREAIRKWGVDTQGDVLRPEAGVAMHDDTPKAAERIVRHGGRFEDASASPLFVVIDFDGNASFPLDEEPPWLPFMGELLGYSWVRLIVIGAPETITSGISNLAQREQELETTITLNHVDKNAFQAFALKLLRHGRPPSNATRTELTEAMNLYVRILEAFPGPALQTTVSALAGILLQKSLENALCTKDA